MNLLNLIKSTFILTELIVKSKNTLTNGYLKDNSDAMLTTNSNNGVNCCHTYSEVDNNTVEK